MMAKTAVLGIGNIILKDDGLGVYVIQALQKEEDLCGIELVDGGTSTFDMLEYFTDYDRVIVIDCLKVNNPPGTIYKVSPDEIPNYKGEYLSLHDVQIIDIIKIANMLGKYPKVTVYGVEPQEISFGIGLTDEIQTVMPKVINYLKKEILEEK